jgi:cold shock CspA family protein
MTDEFFGTVKFYNHERSFGFIKRDDGADDMFVGAYAAGLHAGDKVSFRLEIGHGRRQRAVNVKVRDPGPGNGAADERERVWRHDGDA